MPSETAIEGPAGVDVAFDAAAGVLTVRDRRSFRDGRRGFGRRLLDSLMHSPGVASASIDLPTATCRVAFDADSAEARAMAAAFVAAVREASAEPLPVSGPIPAARWSSLEACRVDGGISVREAPASSAPPSIGGPRRLMYLALAGGSAVIMAGAIVVPGLPTVPWLLATSYYLARSSPRLDARLRRAPLLGRVIREWEDHGRISRSSKRRLMGLTVAIVAVTVVLAPMAPAVLVVVLLAASLSLLGVARMPEIGTPPQAALMLNPA